MCVNFENEHCDRNENNSVMTSNAYENFIILQQSERNEKI